MSGGGGDTGGQTTLGTFADASAATDATDGPRYRDADWLREQYVEERRSQTALADECGVTGTTIGKWLNRHGIAARSISEAKAPGADRRYHDPDWLREQYVEEHRSTYDLADECGVGSSTISEWLNRHGIETRGRSGAHAPDANTRYENADWLREQYVAEGRAQGALADECGVDRSTICRWLNHHGIETRPFSEVHAPDADCRYHDPDWLREQYVERERSTRDIAAECDVARGTICRWLNRHGIETRDLRDYYDGSTLGFYRKLRHTDADAWEPAAAATRETAGDACEVCGATVADLPERDRALDVHHVVPVLCGGPNSQRNLMVLCPEHHDAAEAIAESVFTRVVAYADDDDLARSSRCP